MMNNRFCIVFLLFVFCFLNSIGQEINRNLLIGKNWKFVKKERTEKDTDSLLLFGNNAGSVLEDLIFLDDDNGKLVSSEINFVYRVNGNELSLGNREYIIENLTKEQLIFIDKKQTTSISVYRYYYKREK